MKKENKKVIIFLMTISLLFTSFSSGTMISFGSGTIETETQSNVELSDIGGHWGENSIKNAVKAGFVEGYEDGTFKPNQAVSRAEFVAMVNKALQLRDDNTVKLLFSDVKENAWYYKEIQKASYSRYINGISDASFMPNKTITRQEAATMLSRFLPESESGTEKSLDGYPDGSLLSNWAREAMAVLVDKGYITGHDDGNLSPRETLTRAEAAKIIVKILEKENIIRENISVNKTGEILKDKIYVGDITIEKSVGEGEATLQNLSALSKVYVLGGGVKTVTIKDTVIIQLIVCKEGARVRVLSDGNSKVHKAFVYNDNLAVDRHGQSIDSGKGGFENVIYLKGSISAEMAMKISAEIAKRIDSSGKISLEQVQEGIIGISPDSDGTINENGSIMVSLGGLQESSGGSNSTARPPKTVPKAPTNVKGTVKDGLPAVGYTTPESNGGSPITEYTVNVYEGGMLKTTGAGVSNPIIITGLTNGTSYTFKVKATNAIGDSAESEESEPIILATINNRAAVLSSIAENRCDCGVPITAGGFEYVAEFYSDITDAESITGYAISNETQLQHLALHVHSNAVLMNDLDFSGITSGAIDISTPMGALKAAIGDYGISYAGHPINSFTSSKFVPIGINTNPYTGTFCGNEKKIKNLIISAGAVNYVGLFGYTSEAVIKDLLLIDGEVRGNAVVGGVVGHNLNGTISAIHHSGRVSATGSVAGGLVGKNVGVVMDSNNTGSISAKSHTGGITGITEGTIRDSYNTGSIFGIQNSNGGVVGYLSSGTVTNCYNTGQVVGSSVWNGGIAGDSLSNEVFSNCFNLGAVVGINSDAGGILGTGRASVSDSYNTGPVQGKWSGGVIGSNLETSWEGSIRRSYNTGAVAGTTVGGIIGKNSGDETENSWLEGTNINGTAGIGEGSAADTTTTFSAIDPTMDLIYNSMMAITERAGGQGVGAITSITANENTLPAFNRLQGSYITSASALTITVTAISGTTVSVASGGTLEALLLSSGDEIAPTEASDVSYTYNFYDLDMASATWIMIKAVNIDTRYNRTYFIVNL